MKTLILEIRKGGLGDHLFYSHIPRAAKETGAYDKVYISNHSFFRNQANKMLVWELNPFIDGFTNDRGIFHSLETPDDGQNLLDSLMLLYGIDDGKRHHEPEVFYRPDIRPELSEMVIYDPNYISYTGDIAKGNTIRSWFAGNHIHVDFQMKQLGNRYLGIDGLATIESSSLLDFCALIVSAKAVYCLTTGTATLAAALQVPVTVLYGTGHFEIYRHSKLHTYVHLESDYTFKDKLKKMAVVFISKFVRVGAR